MFGHDLSKKRFLQAELRRRILGVHVQMPTFNCCLRKKMNQVRPTHLMLFPDYKAKTDELDLTQIANQFSQGNRGRSFTFVRFTKNDFPKLSLN